MALSDLGLETEGELEPGPSNKSDTSPLEHLESPGDENDAAPGPSSIGGSGRLDRELPTFTNAGEDQLQTGNGDERQQISSGKE